MNTFGWLIVSAGLVPLLFGIVMAVAATSREPGVVTPLCMDSETREHVRSLMLTGLEKALQQHTSDTFGVWMADKSEQPKRAINGMYEAIGAYTRSRAAVKAWNPTRCPERMP